MTERIKKAIDIFLDAINEGTLAKGDCAACAVGNLCANAIGIKPVLKICGSTEPEAPHYIWKRLFFTSYGVQTIKTIFYSPDKVKEAEILISKTDFSKEELMRIEYAFECNTFIKGTEYDEFSKQEIRADQIRGLEAVVKVMLEFDDCKEEVTEVFTKRADLIPV